MAWAQPYHAGQGRRRPQREGDLFKHVEAARRAASAAPRRRAQAGGALTRRGSPWAGHTGRATTAPQPSLGGLPRGERTLVLKAAAESNNALKHTRNQTQQPETRPDSDTGSGGPQDGQLVMSLVAKFAQAAAKNNPMYASCRMMPLSMLRHKIGSRKKSIHDNQ